LIVTSLRIHTKHYGSAFSVRANLHIWYLSVMLVQWRRVKARNFRKSNSF